MSVRAERVARGEPLLVEASEESAAAWRFPVEPTPDELAHAPGEYLATYYYTAEERELKALREAVEALTAGRGSRAAMTNAASPCVRALDEMPELLTAGEAATALRTSRRNLNRWIASGRLHAVKGGAGGSSRVLVPRKAVAAFLESLED